MDLAFDVGVSPRHLSFVELGKSRPSPEVLVLIADRLGVSLRERNEWLLAAGYAPRYPENPLDGSALMHVRRSLRALLNAHDPFPAVVIDRRWTVQLANDAALRLVEGITDDVRGVPTNVFRATLHPRGLASRTRNFAEWSTYMVRQLDVAVERTRDPELVVIADEVGTWPNLPDRSTWSKLSPSDGPDVVVPWILDKDGDILSLFTTMATFGTPVDVTLEELAIELFFPADAATEAALRRYDADTGMRAAAHARRRPTQVDPPTRSTGRWSG